MNVSTTYPITELTLFVPQPNVFYSLDTTAHLSGVSRRSILIYYRAGFVNPVFQPPYELMEFTEEAIHAIRRIEHLRVVHKLELAWIKTLLGLFDEVERLRTELRFFRKS